MVVQRSSKGRVKVEQGSSKAARVEQRYSKGRARVEQG